MSGVGRRVFEAIGRTQEVLGRAIGDDVIERKGRIARKRSQSGRHKRLAAMEPGSTVGLPELLGWA